MTDLEKGGPAFPGPIEASQSEGQAASMMMHPGMTLRDYFAAKVLAGLHANKECNVWPHSQFAEYAYAAADAMLEARNA